MRILWVVFLIMAPLLCLSPTRAHGDEVAMPEPQSLQRPSSVEAFGGENFIYDISFLWFDRLAQGRLSFTSVEQPNSFRAELEGKTLGVAAWLTGDRVQRYVSVMQKGEDGMLHSLIHESHIFKKKKGKKVDQMKRFTFDRSAKTILFQKYRDNTLVTEEVIPWSEEDWPDDFLTAFYNFRIGNFGAVKPGSRYTIPTFTRKGPAEIVVEIYPQGASRPSKFFPKGGLLAKIVLDPEIFDTGGGAVFAWFDNFGRPGRGIIENVVGMGDVKGVLRQ